MVGDEEKATAAEGDSLIDDAYVVIGIILPPVQTHAGVSTLSHWPVGIVGPAVELLPGKLLSMPGDH